MRPEDIYAADMAARLAMEYDAEDINSFDHFIGAICEEAFDDDARTVIHRWVPITWGPLRGAGLFITRGKPQGPNNMHPFDLSIDKHTRSVFIASIEVIDNQDAGLCHMANLTHGPYFDDDERLENGPALAEFLRKTIRGNEKVDTAEG